MRTARALATIGCALLLSACMQIAPPPRAPWPSVEVGKDGPARNLDAACVADYRPGVDYFPQKTRFTHSAQLQVEYAPHYKRVRFTPSVATGEVIEFLFVQCGTPTPPHGPHVPVVEVPVRRLVTGNSAMLGALDELGLVDRLHGSESTRGATVPAVRERIAQGLVHEMSGYGHASIEPVMAVQADVYLSFYSAYPQGNVHPRLWELGVRAIPQADHHEPHPLGRAEWLKLLALFSNREARGDANFAEIAAQYAHWKAVAAQARSRPRPRVMAGFASSRDTIEAFGGRNHRAQLIRDAGGAYVLGDDPRTSSLVYEPFEKVYAQGADAAVWLGTLGGQADRKALVAANTLHGWFDAVDEGRVYAWDRGYTGAWAYPYQDQGMTRPHIQLAEAIGALHPELAGAQAPAQFLRRLP
jgi:iron complex transport system substrate-binding protein